MVSPNSRLEHTAHEYVEQIRGSAVHFDIFITGSSAMFKGRIEDTNIVVDRFDNNISSTVYMVSHAHSDHYKGLTSDHQGPIHCSYTTARLLAIRTGVSKSSFVCHDIKEPFTITCIRGNGLTCSVCVTFIDANHCPGAVMILFDFAHMSVLYTGDFRYHQRMMASIPNRIDHLIFDSTFFHPSVGFPSKEESLEALLRFVKRALPCKRIYLACELLGSEEALILLCSHLNSKLFVSSDVYDDSSDWNRHTQLLALESTQGLVTSDANSILHLRENKGFSQFAMSRDNSSFDECFIKPSAMWFAQKMIHLASSKYKVVEVSKGVVHICFSMHSDFAEIKEFIKAVKPAKITPMVFPPGYSSISEFQATLSCHTKCLLSTPSRTRADSKPNPGILLKRVCLCENSKYLPLDITEGWTPKKIPAHLLLSAKYVFVSEHIPVSSRFELVNDISKFGGKFSRSIEGSDIYLLDISIKNSVHELKSIICRSPRIQVFHISLFAALNSGLVCNLYQCLSICNHLVYTYSE